MDEQLRQLSTQVQNLTTGTAIQTIINIVVLIAFVYIVYTYLITENIINCPPGQSPTTNGKCAPTKTTPSLPPSKPGPLKK